MGVCGSRGWLRCVAVLSVLSVLSVLGVTPAVAGPVVLGGEDTTDHGGTAPVPLPGTGVTVVESESNDTFMTADPVTLGDDFTGEFSLTTAPATGAVVAESEPNDDTGSADPVAVGDDYAGGVPVSVGPASGATVTETEANDTSVTANPVAVGDDIEGAVSVTVAPLSGGAVAETESNDSFMTADAMAVGDVYTGAISPMADQDFVAFTVAGPTTIVAGLSSDFDSRLELRDTNGTDVLQSEDDSDGVFSEEIVFDLPAAGTYFLVVDSCCPGGSSGAYSLELTTVATSDLPDFFAFAVAGAGTFSVRSVTSGGLEDVRLRILDTDGTTVLFSRGIAGAPEQLFFDLPAAGTYFLHVFLEDPFDRGGTLDYRLELRSASVDPGDFAEFTLGAPTTLAFIPDISDPLLAAAGLFEFGFQSIPLAFLTPGTATVRDFGVGTDTFGLRSDGFEQIGVNGGGTYTVSLREVTAEDLVDFVSFTVAAPTSVLLTYRGALSSSIRLLDTDGVTSLTGGFEVGPFGDSRTIAFDLAAAGTYFVKLERDSFAGEYTLETRIDSGVRALDTGWEYIQHALEAISPLVTRPGNDGGIAALGSAPSDDDDDDAGAAIGAAGAAAGLLVSYYNGATAIAEFFADLMAGVEKPAIIWIAGTGASNDLNDSEGAAITANGDEIAAFVLSGGGVMAHGSGPRAYGWLPSLLPGAANVDPGPNGDNLELTPAGTSFLPGVTDEQLNDGPWHSYFAGDFGPLEVLAESSDLLIDGQPVAIIIGGVFAPPEPPAVPDLGPGPIEPGTEEICGTASPDLSDGCIEVCILVQATDTEECLGTSGTDDDGRFCVELDRPVELGEQVVVRDNCGGTASPVFPVQGPAPLPALSALAMSLGLLVLIATSAYAIRRRREAV